MAIHIGSIIQKVIDDKRVQIKDVAAKLKMHPGSISRVVKYPYMSTKLVEKFCVALDYDFFKHFSDDLKLPSAEKDKTSTEKLLEECRKENERCMQEVSYLKEINVLLKK
jgi:DNA-directed RNA polymerase specialized sigma54-like protein